MDIDMVMVDKFHELETLEQVDDQIIVRQRLILQMVGSLYPSILNDEINKLIERKRQILEMLAPLAHVHDS